MGDDDHFRYSMDGYQRMLKLENERLDRLEKIFEEELTDESDTSEDI